MSDVLLEEIVKLEKEASRLSRKIFLLELGMTFVSFLLTIATIVDWVYRVKGCK